MRIALITPPLLQPNSPYPAMPVIAGFLRGHGAELSQHDFSLELLLRIMTPGFIRKIAEQANQLPQKDEQLQFYIDTAKEYSATVGDVVSFLQGKVPELAWRIASRNWLPEGPFFTAAMEQGDDDGSEALSIAFGNMGTYDQAKFLASLYMDDLAAFITVVVPDFGFAKFAEKLALSLPDFSPVEERLKKTDLIDEIIDEMTAEMLENQRPDIVGISVPFPGTLYAAFRIAATIKRIAPQVKLVLGGGYVNSELRELDDRRVFSYFDYICYDEGFQPWLTILNGVFEHSSEKTPGGSARLLTADGLCSCSQEHCSPLLVPDYDGLDLSRYFSVVEMPNCMHRIWTDGLWIKMQLAQGCYWHKCAFCDLSLDYICRYEPATPKDIVDAMEKLVAKTGRHGFHFVDEALSPALVRGLCTELISRSLNISWWGNIRFDKAFTPELAQLMSDSGCIAVTGGLECAEDRLLKLMNKGITLASARSALKAFSDAGILVHAYLMYGFPTETESEALSALKFVRDCFAEGLLQSAYWHRFALTAHSPIASNPDKFGITIMKNKQQGPRFALNELQFAEKNAPNWERIGHALSTAVYNYMLGIGLDMPVKKWLRY